LVLRTHCGLLGASVLCAVLLGLRTTAILLSRLAPAKGKGFFWCLHSVDYQEKSGTEAAVISARHRLNRSWRSGTRAHQTLPSRCSPCPSSICCRTNLHFRRV